MTRRRTSERTLRGVRQPARGLASGPDRDLAVASVILLFFTLTTFAGVWTDHLWFDSLGYGKVFSTIFWVKIALFLAFGGSWPARSP